MSDVDDEWEQDLDIELTEEDMKAAEELAKKLGDNFDLEVGAFGSVLRRQEVEIMI